MKDTKATIQYAGDDYFVAVPPSGHALTIDIKGERSNGAGPMELLLVALGACTAADIISILRKMREQVTAYRVEVRGEAREEYPKSFRKMEVRHLLRGRGIKSENVAKAIELSMTKYCGVAATLRPTAEIVSTFEIEEDQAAGA